MKQSRLPDHLRRKGLRSPGRRGTRALSQQTASVERFAMRGDVPRELEEDREFFLLFQEWKASGAKPDNPITQKLRARAAVVLGKAEPTSTGGEALL